MNATTDAPRTTFNARVSAPPGSLRHRGEHAFFIGSAVYAIAVSVVGFVPGMMDGSRRSGPMTPLVAVHGLTMAAWLALYLVQTILAGRGQLQKHRALGAAGALLAAAIVVVGIVTTFAAAARGFDLSGDLVRFDNRSDFIGLMVLPFGDGLLFGAIVMLALLYRTRPAVHKRLMYFAIFGGLMGAPMAHIVGHFDPPAFVPAVIMLPPLLGCIVSDLVVHRHVHAMSWVAPLCVVAFNFGRNVVMSSTTIWHDFMNIVLQ